MPRVADLYELPEELVLGTRLTSRVPEADQVRQRAEVHEILRRLRTQPGVILADEVGMGKTFVALGIAYSIAMRSARGPVIVMVPPNLVSKWEQDLKTFCELYLENRRPVKIQDAVRQDMADPSVIRYGVADHSVELLKLLDNERHERAHLIFLKQGAMVRQQTDRWVRLALIAEALRSHGRGKARKLILVKKQIHRFMGRLLYASGLELANDWGDDLWRRLLKSDPTAWRDIYNGSVADSKRRLRDDPVPKAVSRGLLRINLKPLAEALEQMPIRAKGGDARISERLRPARWALREVENELWKTLLAQARWRSPLLVMDEAHHLKNPATSLARTFQVADLDKDLKTGDGAMAQAFDRMLFLTATPFQLGHQELVRVLERVGDVRWDDGALGPKDRFVQCLGDLERHLNDSQRGAIALQRSWTKLRLEDCDPNDVDAWWATLLSAERDSLNHRQKATVEAYGSAKRARDAAEAALRPWIVRHNKGAYWAGTTVARRERLQGAAIGGDPSTRGLVIPPTQLLPFFLGARSAANPSAELLSEALCSSYEAFRFTRERNVLAKDDENQAAVEKLDLSQSGWYLNEFDRALESTQGASHPKVHATVQKAVDLWESGEKVLVFAFYRHTCRALRIHISREIERRLSTKFDADVENVQKRFFDDSRSPGWKAMDRRLRTIVDSRTASLDAAGVSVGQRHELTNIMRRFLRAKTTLVRCFPFPELDALKPAEAVARTLDYRDSSNTSWRQKFDGFIDFLAECSSAEREAYLDVASRIQTGGIRVEDEDEEGGSAPSATVTVPNVQVATGKTKTEARARLMRAFNTPFLPDILVCSEVMGEGVDLQRACRHVIHHDLAWNPSTIEQRTGRIDRLGCKAEGRQPIVVYLPFLDGTADERQYQVMSHREQWFRVVMGQEEVARLITTDSAEAIRLPAAISNELSFKLDLART